MMWSDKAFGIYMGEAGTVTPLEATSGVSDGRDGLVSRHDVGHLDDCSDGDTQRAGWLTRVGTRLAERTQLRGAARG